MLPDKREISESLYGSWLLARQDIGGYGRFVCTTDGFWRSFAAIILIAPFYFSFASLERDLVAAVQNAAQNVPGSAFYVAKAVALIADWAGYPLLVAAVAGLLGFTERYALYIIAYNWSSVLVIGFLSPPFLLHGLGLIEARSAVLLTLILSLPVLYYRWYIARTALETTALTATGLVLLDLSLSMLVNKGAERLFG